jgi:hypothetical protein
MDAAHCPDGNIWMNGHYPSNTISAIYGPYRDFQIYETGDAHYWTWTGNSGWQDFNTVYTTPVVGQWTCKYGRNSDYGCGSLSNIYYPFPNDPISGGTVYRHIVSGVSCANGDSGGPVWTSSPSGPASRNEGIITGSNALGCDYLALDYQLTTPTLPLGFWLV